MHIKYTINKDLGAINSFLRKIEYSAYYREALEEFADDFPGIELLNVDLREKYRGDNGISPREMGNLIGRDRYDITIDFSIYQNNKGGLNEPTTENIFQTIKYTMRDEAKNYSLLRDRKNPKLITRLKQLNIDMSNNKNLAANELHGSLGSNNYKLDLDKRIWSLSQEDLYQLGRVIIVSDTGGKIFSQDQIIRQMAEKLEISEK